MDRACKKHKRLSQDSCVREKAALALLWINHDDVLQSFASLPFPLLQSEEATKAQRFSQLQIPDDDFLRLFRVFISLYKKEF
jgi:hypothetical protein